MKHSIKQDNFNINIMSTKKFKSTRIHISFGSLLSKETVSKRAILPYLLRAISKKYDTRASLSSYLDNLYAAQFSAGTSKVGLTHFVSFDCSVINDKYTIDQEALLEKGIDFIKEIILNPLFKEEIFLEEKRLLKEYFLSAYANKMRYTIKELQKSMFEDEMYRISPLGLEEDIDSLTLEDVIEEYHKMINTDKITISIVGDVEKDPVVKILNDTFHFTDRSLDITLLEENPVKENLANEIILEQDVTQAKLAQGYRFDVRYLSDEYYAAIVFNSLLGGSSDALLHQRIREELGLVYFVSSSYDFYKGVLFIFSGIDEANYDQTKTEIASIIQSAIDGTFKTHYLEVAKKIIINGIIESQDSNYSLVIRLERKDLFKRDIPLEETIKNINNVTIKDIQEIAKKLLLDTTVLLRGEQDE